MYLEIEEKETKWRGETGEGEEENSSLTVELDMNN